MLVVSDTKITVKGKKVISSSQNFFVMVVYCKVQYGVTSSGMICRLFPEKSSVGTEAMMTDGSDDTENISSLFNKKELL
jgi:hypothetical protein